MRYSVKFEMFVWGDNKRDALKEAELIAKILNYQYDNSAKVIEIKRAEFGKIKEGDYEKLND